MTTVRQLLCLLAACGALAALAPAATAADTSPTRTSQAAAGSSTTGNGAYRPGRRVTPTAHAAAGAYRPGSLRPNPRVNWRHSAA
jgi:hypothetical protein